MCCPETSSKQDQFPGFDCLILGGKKTLQFEEHRFLLLGGVSSMMMMMMMMMMIHTHRVLQ